MARKRRIYEPLSKNEFRVLIVKPGRHDDPIRCKLKVHSLDEQPVIPFETISYVWGDPRAQRRIFLNGRAVYVPISTKQAIKRMRLPTEQRTLWIDAVCINQKDLDERSQQVAFMGRIYSYGIRNLIFLGNDPGNIAESVFTAIEAAFLKLSAAIGLESDEAQRYWRHHRIEPHQWKTSPPLIESDVVPLERLFEHPWFTRLWVMQEACLANKNLVCFGKMQCDIGQLSDICSVAGVASGSWSRRAEAKVGLFTLCSLQFIIWDIRVAREMLDVYNVFILAQTLVTKERHDRVFAVRDLLLVNCENHEISNLLAVDYRKSIGAVFRDATIYALMTSRTDRILNHICHREEADMFAEGRTSWTAAWYQELNWERDSCKFRWHEMSAGLLDTDVERSLNVVAGQDNGVLSMKSLVLPELRDVKVPLKRFFGHDLDALSIALEVVETLLASNSASTVPDYEYAVELLTGGWWRDDFNGLHQAAQGLRDLHACLRADKSSSSPGSQLDLCEDLHNTIGELSSNRCFFVMNSGLVGSGPKIMRAGDRVAVAIGAHLPWIIRPSGRDDGSYYFIGTAYIPGLVKGEVFEIGLEEEVVKLR